MEQSLNTDASFQSSAVVSSTPWIITLPLLYTEEHQKPGITCMSKHKGPKPLHLMHHPNLDYVDQWTGELSQNPLCQILGALKRPSWKEKTYLLILYRPFPVRRYNCRCAEGMPESFICYWPDHKGYIINNWCLQTELIYHREGSL